jgi:hypothetical protein
VNPTIHIANAVAMAKHAAKSRFTSSGTSMHLSRRSLPRNGHDPLGSGQHFSRLVNPCN